MIAVVLLFVAVFVWALVMLLIDFRAKRQLRRDADDRPSGPGHRT